MPTSMVDHKRWESFGAYWGVVVVDSLIIASRHVLDYGASERADSDTRQGLQDAIGTERAQSDALRGL